MVPFLDPKAQQRPLAGELKAAAARVLDSGWYVLGKELAAFEQEFAAFAGVRHCIGVGSGTDALQLALRAVGVTEGSEVVTTALTCVPTIAAIAAIGAKPILADADPDTLTMTAAAIERRITTRTKAIVPVHLYGHPCDMDPLLALASGLDIPVVEDCGQAHGAQYRGRSCGSLGSAAAFSFHPSTNLGAYGDGGAVTTSDAKVAERLRRLRNHGEERRHQHRTFGLNSRLDELQAAFLRVKLPHLPRWNEARRAHAAQYRTLLRAAPLTLPAACAWARPCYPFFVVRTTAREEVRQRLTVARIETCIHYPLPVHVQEACAHLGYAEGSFPVAEEACREVLSLPLYPEIPEEHLDQVAAVLNAL